MCDFHRIQNADIYAMLTFKFGLILHTAKAPDAGQCSKKRHGMDRQFANKAMGRMLEVSGTNLSDIKAFSQLTDHRVDEPLLDKR